MFKINKALVLNNRDTDTLSFLFYAFHKAKYELYLVGGCVRDLLLGKEPHDFDLCTNATPEEIKAIIDSYHGIKNFNGHNRYNYWDSGIKHGTLTITDSLNELSYEITTYRIDGKYEDGRHSTEVAFTPSLEEDLKRRDFTVNSFAYNILTNELLMLDESYMYDLSLGIIRCVGVATDRFQEDALRMLRAIRFSAQLGFTVEEDTFEAIKVCAPLLKKISKERIRDELTKILLSENPHKMELLSLTGVDEYVWSEECSNLVTSLLNCTQHNKYHYTDVFHHTMDVIKPLPKEFVLRWAAFFHDIGKPIDETVDEEGYCHYYTHPEKSAALCLSIMETLKFSNSDKEMIYKFVKYHDYPLSKVGEKKFKNMIVIIGEENFPNFLKLREADATAHKLAASTDFAIKAISVVKERFMNYLMHPVPLRVCDLSINGEDIKALGLVGKEIGDALKACLEEVLEHPEHNTKEFLISFVEEKKHE